MSGVLIPFLLPVYPGAPHVPRPAPGPAPAPARAAAEAQPKLSVRVKGGFHVPGIDCNLSPPKSMSVLLPFASPTDRAALEAAHLAAVRVTVAAIEDQVAMCRPSIGGRQVHAPGELAVGVFTHHTSRPTTETTTEADRPPDPQLHSHAFIFNLAWCQGRYLAVDSRPLYQFAKTAEAIYGCELAAQLQALGYRLEWQQTRTGPVWEVAGVDRQVVELFSSRHRQIEQLASEFQARRGRPPTLREHRQLAVRHRHAKAPAGPGGCQVVDWPAYRAVLGHHGLDAPTPYRERKHEPERERDLAGAGGASPWSTPWSTPPSPTPSLNGSTPRTTPPQSTSRATPRPPAPLGLLDPAPGAPLARREAAVRGRLLAPDGLTANDATFTTAEVVRGVYRAAAGLLDTSEARAFLDRFLDGPDLIPVPGLDPGADPGADVEHGQARGPGPHPGPGPAECTAPGGGPGDAATAATTKPGAGYRQTTDRQTTDRWTTRLVVAHEQQLVERARWKASPTWSPAPAAAMVTQAAAEIEAEAGYRLSDEQRQALEHLCHPSGWASLEGRAGTGKTSTVRAAVRAFTLNRQPVMVVSTAADTALRTAAELGLARGYTVEAFHDAVWSGRLRMTDRTVVIVEEAVMVDTHRMVRLVEAAGPASIRTLGDPEQAQAVGAGGWHPLVDQAIGGHAELVTVIRQRDPADRAVCQAVRDGDAAEALRDLWARGRVHLAADPSATVKETVYAWDRHRQRAGLQGVAIVTDTDNKTIDTLNSLCQARRRAAGELSGAGIELMDRRTGRRERLYVGDQVCFTRPYRSGDHGDSIGDSSGKHDQVLTDDRDGAQPTTQTRTGMGMGARSAQGDTRNVSAGAQTRVVNGARGVILAVEGAQGAQRGHPHPGHGVLAARRSGPGGPGRRPPGLDHPRGAGSCFRPLRTGGSETGINYRSRSLGASNRMTRTHDRP